MVTKIRLNLSVFPLAALCSLEPSEININNYGQVRRLLYHVYQYSNLPQPEILLKYFQQIYYLITVFHVCTCFFCYTSLSQFIKKKVNLFNFLINFILSLYLIFQYDHNGINET